MKNRIAQALTKLFDRHRIVFWYDAKQEFRHDYSALNLPGIEKITLTNNEFGVKHRTLREQTEQKFLLYREGPQPADLDNWLLDVQLAHGEFRTDQVAIWLSELELGLEFTDVVQVHAEFFQAIKRKDALKKLLKADDTAGQIRLKMLAVCTGSEPRMDAVVENLLQELAEFIYHKAFVNYTSKQWGMPPEAISPEVTARVPVVVSRDDRYFTDPFQAVPQGGYSAMVAAMLAHPNIELQLSTPMSARVALDWGQGRVMLDGAPFTGPLIYTGMRWHVRAYCEKRGDYLDFVMSRFRGVPELLDSSSHGRELDHFQRFVCPQRRPLLTHFCRQLTHIQQAQIDGAERFPVVWNSFEQWLAPHLPRLAGWLSWGDYDRRQIEQECRQHQLDSTFLQIPRNPTSLESVWSAKAHITPVR